MNAQNESLASATTRWVARDANGGLVMIGRTREKLESNMHEILDPTYADEPLTIAEEILA